MHECINPVPNNSISKNGENGAAHGLSWVVGDKEDGMWLTLGMNGMASGFKSEAFIKFPEAFIKFPVSNSNLLASV